MQNTPGSFSASVVILGLLLGMALGLLGQGMRVIIGLKKAAASQEKFDPIQFFISLMIGAIAGGLAALPMLSQMCNLTYPTIVALLGAGYAGADFIEGFMAKAFPGGGPLPTPQVSPLPPVVNVSLSAPSSATPAATTAAIDGPTSTAANPTLFATPIVEPAANQGTPIGDFATASASSQTSDGQGASTTTGLTGKIYQSQGGTQIIDASETLTAKRDGHSLGAARVVRQMRTKTGDTTQVQQANYPWGKRSLSDVQLIENSPGFGGAAGVISGRATFFGKGDQEDEGTGIPMFGTVQTNSDVFGISLKESLLLDQGLAIRAADGTLHATDKGLAAKVEVYFPSTRRLASLPIVDLGPSESINAIADLTVAAAAFLQAVDENGASLKSLLGKLDNIVVQARIVA